MSRRLAGSGLGDGTGPDPPAVVPPPLKTPGSAPLGPAVPGPSPAAAPAPDPAPLPLALPEPPAAPPAPLVAVVAAGELERPPLSEFSSLEEPFTRFPAPPAKKTEP